MAIPLLPSSASSPMSTAVASAARTRAVAAKSRDGGVRHFLSPSLSPSLLLPPRSSLICRLVVGLMPLPLILSTLPPPLNGQPRPIKAPLPLVRWCLSSRLPLVCGLVVALPVVPCLHLGSPFVAQPPHASILDPITSFMPAGCHVTSLCTTSASQPAAASRLAVLLPLPMRRRCCRQCACIFAVVAIAIVALVTCHKAGVIDLVVVDVDVCCHHCH